RQGARSRPPQPRDHIRHARDDSARLRAQPRGVHPMRSKRIKLGLGGSSDGSRRGVRARRERRRGVALVIAITAVAILGVLLADMHRSTTTGYVVATTQRDSLRAEYMAKSGLN